jgi:hypothetical protein
MSNLLPRKYLSIDTVDVKKLPLAVVIRNGPNITVYKIESENVQLFFDGLGKVLPPFIEILESSAKRFGREISSESFLNAAIYPEPEYKGGKLPEIEYIMYRIKPEENQTKMVCNTKTGVCD